MFKNAAVALTLASVVLAQSASQSAASSIPSTSTPGCSGFLTQLDANPTINTCLSSLIDATSDFGPGTTASASSATSALDHICSGSVGCDSTTVRSLLADFYTACSTELGNGNQPVIDIYDVLYLIVPLKNAVCTKNNGAYCATTMTHSSSSNNSGSSSAPAQGNDSAAASPSDTNTPASSQPAASSSAAPSSLTTSSGSATPSASATHAKRAANIVPRGEGDQQTIDTFAPHAASYNNNGLPYLFLTPNITDQAQLCSPCTSKVIGSYISFESITPYAIGIANSPTLSGQVTLWNHIKEVCPTDFTSGLLTNATTSTSSTNSDDSSDALATLNLGAGKIVGAIVTAMVGAWLF